MSLSRRFLLRGMTHSSLAVMSLPFLDCFLNENGTALAATGKPIPTRFGTYFWGCGLTKALFMPASVGANYQDTPQLASLKPFKGKMNLLTGFRAFVDEKPNIQHWSGNAAIATGNAPANDREFAGETLDMTIAGAIAKGSRYKSIEVACSGNRNESFSSLGGRNTNPPEVSPIGLYNRLFGAGFQDPSNADWKPDPHVMLQQSVLSVVTEDRQKLMASVGAADKARLEQYFTSVRELEQGLAAELSRPEMIADVKIPASPEEMIVNKAVPNLLKVTPIMARLLAIGLATNQTRVFNMSFCEPASTMYQPGDSYPFHQATHEEPVDEALGYQPITSKFSEYCMQGLASVLAELDGIREGDGTLLDHSLLLAYTDTSNAKLHAIDGIPMVLAGGANGKIKTGLHVAGGGTTVSRVGLTVQQAMGFLLDSWGTQSNQTNRPISEIVI